MADLTDDARGIQNVCLGRYESSGGTDVHGPGMCDAAAVRSRELASKLRRRIATSLDTVRAIPTPFDQAILGPDTAPGRVAIQAAIAALEAQTTTLAELAAAYDVRLTPLAPRRRP